MKPGEPITHGPIPERRGALADLNPTSGLGQSGEPPVLVLSHDVFNERSETLFAAALTSQVPRAGTRP
jgi:mRNA-degrading endonuclease toxin of MazEF toxin-antitoxin module